MRIQLATILLWGLGAAFGGIQAVRAEPLDVFVTIPPQKALVERIGADRVRTQVLVSEGKDAHSFEPSPRQAAQLAKAAIYFSVGLPLEELVVPKLREQDLPVAIVDMAKGVKRRAEVCPECGHDHANEGEANEHHEPEQEHQPHDPHVWLAPDALTVMAKNTAEALIRADPKGEKEYRSRLAALKKELEALDTRVAKRLKPYKGRAFYVFHPAYGYFADAYGLRQESIETQGRQLTPKRLRTLIAQARRDKVAVLFSQPQFDRRQADAVARAIGVKVMLVDPLGPDPLETIDTLSRYLLKGFGGKDR